MLNLTVQDIKEDSFLLSILRDVPFMISLEIIFSVQTFVMPDVKLGDLLIHEGYAHDAQAHAAAVYNADKTYFVLNGTSSANKVVLNALLTSRRYYFI